MVCLFASPLHSPVVTLVLHPDHLITHRGVLSLDELNHLDGLLFVVEVVEGDVLQLGQVVALRHYIVRGHQALQWRKEVFEKVIFPARNEILPTEMQTGKGAHARKKSTATHPKVWRGEDGVELPALLDHEGEGADVLHDLHGDLAAVGHAWTLLLICGVTLAF